MGTATASALSTRLLPPEEWSRLADCGLGDLWASLPPATTRIVVVEEDGEIVGHVTGVLMLHAEGAWIAPRHRKRVAVWRRLIEGFWRLADGWGCRAAWASAASDEMRHVLARLHGAPVTGDHVIVLKPEGK